jgi:hypothetical protein
VVTDPGGGGERLGGSPPGQDAWDAVCGDGAGYDVFQSFTTVEAAPFGEEFIPFRVREGGAAGLIGCGAEGVVDGTGVGCCECRQQRLEGRPALR